MGGYRWFSKDRLRGREGFALFVREQQGCMELCLGKGVSWWVRKNILLKWTINKLGSKLYMLPMRKSCSWRSFIVWKSFHAKARCSEWCSWPFTVWLRNNKYHMQCLSQGIHSFQLVMHVLDLNGYNLGQKCPSDAPQLELQRWLLGLIKVFGRLLRFNNVIYGNHKVSTSRNRRFCKRSPFCMQASCGSPAHYTLLMRP